MDLSSELIFITVVSAYLWSVKNKMVNGSIGENFRKFIPDKFLNDYYAAVVWGAVVGFIFYQVHGDDNSSAIWGYDWGYTWVGYGHIGPNLRNIIAGVVFVVTAKLSYTNDGKTDPNKLSGFLLIGLYSIVTMLAFTIFFWNYTFLLVGAAFAFCYRIGSMLSGENSKNSLGDILAGGLIGISLYYYNYQL